MQEIELTFLPKTLPASLARAEHTEMLDIYVPASAEHAILRIRRSGSNYEITKKVPVTGTDSSHQTETTIPLTEAEYTELATIPGKRVEKTRYFYAENGTHYEIDVFIGGLAGLVLVDVEFDSLGERDVFIMPPWCLVDITQEKFIAGGVLCGKSYADIESDLARFGYTKQLRLLA